MRVFTTEEETLSRAEAATRIQENPFEQLLVWSAGDQGWVPWYRLGWLAVTVGTASEIYVHHAEDDTDGQTDAIEPRELRSLLRRMNPSDLQVWQPIAEAWSSLDQVEWIRELFLVDELYYSAAGEELLLPRWEALDRLDRDSASITHVATTVDGSEDLEWTDIGSQPLHWPYPLQEGSEPSKPGETVVPEVPVAGEVPAAGGVPPVDEADTRNLKPGVAVLHCPSPDGLPSETWLIRGTAFSGGRDDTRSTVLLAIEPFDHPERDAANRARSMRISSKHLAVQLSDSGFFITDLNSSNGTCVNDVSLVPQVPTPISAGDVVDVGQELQLACDVQTDASGIVQSGILRRVGNREDRSYVIGVGGMGASLDGLTLINPLMKGQEGVGWRLAWTTNGLRLDIAPQCRAAVSLFTQGVPRGEDEEGPWWVSSGDSIVVGGEVAVAILHVSKKASASALSRSMTMPAQ